MIVCFIGHRKINKTRSLINNLTENVRELVLNGAETFFFGSRSEFNLLCWQVVTKLQEEFTNIIRISYNTGHDRAFTSKEERKKFDDFISKRLKSKVYSMDFEDIIISEKAENATKNIYISRNLEMIDNSDICVFYYDKNYLPPKKQKNDIFRSLYHQNSGTAIAYNYAIRKKKTIINIFNK